MVRELCHSLMSCCLADCLPVYDLFPSLTSLCFSLVGVPTQNAEPYRGFASLVRRTNPKRISLVTVLKILLFIPIIYLSVQSPNRFSKDSVKIAYVASLLEGPPLSYFNALFEQGSPISVAPVCVPEEREKDFP
uniref:Uncharacterized protein n=1 Tax=Sphaeramia orbicularis TaxID=375764 RepID=A0A672ZC77_9TELE